MWKIAQLDISGADNATLEHEIAQLNLNGGVLEKLIRWFSDVREFFDEEVVDAAMAPEADMLRDMFSISRQADDDEGQQLNLLDLGSRLNPAQAAFEQQMMEQSKAAVTRAAEEERAATGKKGQARTPEQRKAEYRKMRAQKRGGGGPRK